MTPVHYFAHNFRYTNDNGVILIALESRLEELSKDRSHAKFRLETQKIWRLEVG